MYFYHHKRASLVVLALLAGLGIIPGKQAWGSNFQVSPVKVSLSSQVSNQVLTIRNTSDETLRFQIKTYAWSQDTQGEMQLTATEDIVVFPGLLSLNPGEERRIRVGTLTPVSTVEKAYRIFVEELPPLKTPNLNNPGIKILTKMGLPIFLQPNQQVIDGRIDNVNINYSRLSFNVKNIGNTHLIAQTIRVKGTDITGKTVFNKERNGWYILPSISQPYELHIPQVDCSKTQTLLIEVKTEQKVLTEKLDIPQGACKNPK
ncbi:fimbria/pilus periplasmic chaperone [Tolypothrix sp. FACHB-123]|uniref:fimbrial biogenesis chaperone n=1 Tax=Tolypothrix sp. FACHB-123 TaxID=2692868 RepID=UPI001683D7CB|nr:fimbria/pilus periplasmic chaperone [Tolypothrix sp. FACHB-123]MBD2359305.1 fimbria/pilus periplasmic chaperone [Tolypothrix sp. FACHB-123]